MLTVKRLYLYGVLGVSLVLLLWGLTDLLRFVLDEVAQAMGSRPAFGGSFAREELSRAVALVIVAGAIFTVHLALVRRTLRGSPAEVADERASASRATYFFLVLIGTGVTFGLATWDLASQLIDSLVFGGRAWDLVGPTGTVIVVGSAWVSHIVVRRGDLRSAPDRTAGDWLTRLYLYGILFGSMILAATASAQVLATVAEGLLESGSIWQTTSWWQEALVDPLAGTLVASCAWLTHWFFVGRLVRAADPMGQAHRSSRMRRGYYQAVVLASAAIVLVLASMSLTGVISEMLGTWRSTDGARLIEDVGGPLVMIVPFAFAWWWHLRRASHEALALGGPTDARDVTRTSRLVVAAVGLAGLAAGVASLLQVFLDAIGSSGQASLFTASTFDDAGAAALAVAIVGLVMWIPAWARSQRDHARNAAESAEATSRRAYLLLVCGLSVVAMMGSMAFLVWQATRVLLDSARMDDSSWALAILAVATIVLVYHLWQLRYDLLAAGAHEAAQPEPIPAVGARDLETIEISAPAGADFRVLNAAILSELPDGYELRVVSSH